MSVIDSAVSPIFLGKIFFYFKLIFYIFLNYFNV
jgi:hypothetical protein